MVSINLKRSAATLGVVAGLLVAAGPASAQDRFVEYDNTQVPPTNTATDTARSSGAEAAKGADFLDVLISSVRSDRRYDGQGTEARGGGKIPPEEVSLGVTADAGAGDDKIWAPGDGSDFLKSDNSRAGAIDGNPGSYMVDVIWQG